MPRVEGGGEVGRGGGGGGRDAAPVVEDSRGFVDPFLSFFFYSCQLGLIANVAFSLVAAGHVTLALARHWSELDCG